MAVLKRVKVDSYIEQRIVTGLIVSKDFLGQIYEIYNPNYFVNTYTRQVSKWAVNFYEVYEEAPYAHIQDIFEKNKSKIKSEDDILLIETLLTRISNRYELEKGLNVDYVLQETRQYFKKRELTMTAGNITELLKMDRLEQAEQQIKTYKILDYKTLGWNQPMSEESVRRYLLRTKDDFFVFPGALGQYVKPIGRGWLVGLAGAFKRGKTWLAQEFGITGIFLGLNVAFVSLEMPEDQMTYRILQRMTAAGKYQGSYRYPVFDCLHNQEASCELPERTQRLPLVNDEGDKPEFDIHHPYRVCTACRNDRELRQNYEMATWYEMQDRPEFNQEEAFKVVDIFQEQYGEKYRTISYPKYSANIATISNDLDRLVDADDFIADLIIVDYAEILKPEDDMTSGIDVIDRTWIALAQMASTRYATVVSPTQVTKKGQGVEILTAQDMARWVGKLAHVDAMFAINQSGGEKEQGLCRIGTVAHRHEEFLEFDTVTVLQQLELGQPHLDSHWR